MLIWKGTVARYCLAGLLGLVFVALSLAGFQVFKDQDFQQARKALDERSLDYVVAVDASLAAHLEPLYSIAGLFNAVADVDRERFRTFNREILARFPDIQALEWIPRVPSAERRDYERRARAEGHTGFQISERDAGGGMVPAADRAEYFPVYYVEPLSGNERALGFDLASNAVRLAALEKARDTGNMVISGRIRLVQETGESFGFLAFLPVYAGDAPPESVDGRRRRLTGFALGVFRVADMVESTLAKRTRPSGLDLYLFDNDAPVDSRLLYFHPSRVREAAIPPESADQVFAGFHVSRTFPVADRQWTVVFKPVPGYFTGETTWTPWMVLFGGLAITGMLVAFLVSVIDRERKVSLLVDERTSALRETEKELRESEERTRAVVDNVVDGIITIDERGVIQSVNPATNRIFGFEAGELEGRNVSILAAEPFREAHDGYLANYMKTGDAKIIGIGREVVGQRRNGGTFPMELAVSELKLAGERLFVGIVRDITERKEVDRMKTEFVSTVSHELRTPLTSIRGSLGLIMGGAVGEIPEKASEMLDLAHKNTERLINLVNDILDMERIESGRLEFHFVKVDVNELVGKAIDANRGYALEHEVDFELTGTVPETHVWGDEDRLAQVMANLLSNAAKFSPGGTKVGISITRSDGSVRIAVTDQGPGIPDDFRDNIFGKFTQADSSDTRQKGGTGLGLSISRAIIEKHGGTLDYDSEAGAGATFYFDLPEFGPDTMMDKAAGEARGSDARVAGKRVLICEDDPDIAKLISVMLQQEGFVTDIAYDANEAKEMLAKSHYDAMTVDIMLPGQDGISLIRELRAADETKDLATVVVSVKAEEAAHEFAATTMGIVDWLGKPLNEGRLLEAVRKAVRGRPGGRPRLLYVEDDKDLVGVITALLDEVADVVPVYTLDGAKELLGGGAFDLVMIDIVLPDGSGLELLPLLKNGGEPSTPVIIFSGGEVDRDTALKVEAVLVKSRTSDGELLATIKSLIATETSH